MKLTTPQKITRAGIYLFAFSLPVSFVPAEFGIALAVLGWLLEGLINKHWQVHWNSFFIPLLFYIGWNLLASTISPRPLHSLWAVADNEWSLLIMLMMYWTVRDRATLRTIVNLFLAFSSVAMVYAIWQTFGGVELYRHMQLAPLGSYFRAVGFYGFYLTFAAFAMSVFFLSAGLFTEGGTQGRKWYSILAVLSFLAVVASFARSIWLSFLVAIPVSGFLRGRKKGLMVTGGLLLVLVASVLFSPSIRSRLESIADLPEQQTRFNLWRTSIRIAQAFPVAGIGEDNFDYYFEKFRVEGYYDVTGHPHNDYFNVLISSGFPGLCAFLAMWVMTIRGGYRAWRRGSDPLTKAVIAGSLLGLVGFLVGSFFQDYYGTFANCLGWWFIVGLLFTASRLSDESTAAQTSS